MFKWYGVLGILLIAFAELNFFFRIEPFATRYFIIIWVGYILTIDAFVYRFRKRSLLMDKPLMTSGLFVLSALFWWLFELMNLRISNWNYNEVEGVVALGNVIWKTIYFSTVLPALFETYELIRGLHLFEKVRFHKKFNITRTTVYWLLGIGIVTFILPLAFPAYFFPLVWVTFFLILDPINYLNGQPSILGHLKKKQWAVPLSLLLAGFILGVLWEFWNYWAAAKWYYNIPFLGFLKIFEMPLLGYLGYFPFALELYAMYWFARGLFVQTDRMLK